MRSREIEDEKQEHLREEAGRYIIIDVETSNPREEKQLHSGEEADDS